jgi:hypothetical protein
MGVAAQDARLCSPKWKRDNRPPPTAVVRKNVIEQSNQLNSRETIAKW